MRLRILGNSALKVSEISLGSWLSVGGNNFERKQLQNAFNSSRSKTCKKRKR